MRFAPRAHTPLSLVCGCRVIETKAVHVVAQRARAPAGVESGEIFTSCILFYFRASFPSYYFSMKTRKSHTSNHKHIYYTSIIFFQKRRRGDVKHAT